MNSRVNNDTDLEFNFVAQGLDENFLRCHHIDCEWHTLKASQDPVHWNIESADAEITTNDKCEIKVEAKEEITYPSVVKTEPVSVTVVKPEPVLEAKSLLQNMTYASEVDTVRLLPIPTRLLPFYNSLNPDTREVLDRLRRKVAPGRSIKYLKYLGELFL